MRNPTLLLLPLAVAQSVVVTVTDGYTTSVTLPPWTTAYAATVTTSTGLTTTTVLVGPSAPLQTSGTSTGLSPAGSNFDSSLLVAETAADPSTTATDVGPVVSPFLTGASSGTSSGASSGPSSGAPSVTSSGASPETSSSFVTSTTTATATTYASGNGTVGGGASGTGVVLTPPSATFTGMAAQFEPSKAALAVILGLAAWMF